jgi:hypothetical protein
VVVVGDTGDVVVGALVVTGVVVGGAVWVVLVAGAARGALVTGAVPGSSGTLPALGAAAAPAVGGTVVTGPAVAVLRVAMRTATIAIKTIDNEKIVARIARARLRPGDRRGFNHTSAVVSSSAAGADDQPCVGSSHDLGTDWVCPSLPGVQPVDNDADARTPMSAGRYGAAQPMERTSGRDCPARGGRATRAAN